MNKAELIDAIAAKAEVKKEVAKKVLEAYVEATTETLKKGDKVALVGFGTFSVAKRAERKGRNPRTKQEMTIPAKAVVKFKAGSELSNL